MSQEMTKIVGIDLGTTYTCIAYLDEHGKPVVVPNFDNNRVTPSVVFFEDAGNRIVGEEAKNQLKVSPDQTIAFVKRDMGNAEFRFEYDGVEYGPEEISGFILKKVIQDAEANLNETITDVVITCPAYFGINEREATKKAGEIAGYNVRAIINEPTAAAIAYGVEQKEDKTILVYDLGGGTFDVTIIEVRPELIKVIVTGGDHNLGGKNWDDAIITYLADRFQEETDTEADILDDQETFNDLMVEAEKAKKTLTQRPKTTISVQHDGDKAKVELTREKFEELTAPLIERTIELTKDMLKEAAKKGVTSFDELILVGGSSRMPQVVERLKAEFSQEPQLMDPDEAVAKGAAIYGQRLAINDELIRRIADDTGVKASDVVLETVDKKVLESAQQQVAEEKGLTLPAVQKASQNKIINVTSKSFGVVAYDETETLKLFNLILKNDAVPTTHTQEFGTHEDNQVEVLLKVMSSEVKDKILDPTEGVEIGEARLSIPPGLPARSPIELTYRIEEDGTLSLKAIEKVEGREVEASIQTNSVISKEEEAAAKERSQGIVVS